MTKPNCGLCVHRRAISGDAHIECAHPKADNRWLLHIHNGQQVPNKDNPLNISAQAHGIRSGWFLWPMRFDSTWLVTCNGFTEKSNVKTPDQKTEA